MANPTLLEMPIARDGAKNSIPSTTSPTTGLLSQQYGWQDINSMPVQQGGKAPSRLDFNGVLNLLSNILFYCQKGWQFEWNSSQDYYAGCIVKDTSDGKMYMCLNDITSTTAPHSDSTNWKLWDLSMLANYLPVSGGTLTGNYINRNIDNGNLVIRGGNSGGGSIGMYGKDFTGREGLVQINADDGNTYCGLNLFSDNQLTHRHTDGTSFDVGSNAIASKSLVANGYTKYADGRIEQWGYAIGKIDGGSASNPNEITFPISFNSTPCLIVTPESTSNGVSAQTSYVGTTNFRLQTSIDNTYCRWLAVGW